jgi:hypothetical protein
MNAWDAYGAVKGDVVETIPGRKVEIVRSPVGLETSSHTSHTCQTTDRANSRCFLGLPVRLDCCRRVYRTPLSEWSLPVLVPQPPCSLPTSGPPTCRLLSAPWTVRVIGISEDLY